MISIIIIIIINVLRTQRAVLQVLFAGSRCLKKRDVSNKDDYTIVVSAHRIILDTRKRVICGKVEYRPAGSGKPRWVCASNDFCRTAGLITKSCPENSVYTLCVHTNVRVAVVKRVASVC